jgi:hypothetical protein
MPGYWPSTDRDEVEHDWRSHGLHDRRSEKTVDDPVTRRPPTAELLAWAAAVLSAIAAAAGLFSPVLYRDAPFWTEQARGIDLATLFLAVPILIVSLCLSERVSTPARLVAVGVVLYLSYNYAIYTTSIVMNRLALVYIAVLGLSVWSLVLLLPGVELAATASNHSPRRVIAAFLLVVAMLFAVLWLSQIANSAISDAPPADLKRAGLPANPVYALDLAIFLPLTVVAAIGLLRSDMAAAAFTVPMLVWTFLTSAGIIGGFFFEAMAGEQIPAALPIVLGLLGILAAILSGLALRPVNR